MRFSDTVILVFAKAPEAGKVNTRLIPDIGVQAATQLQDDLLHQRLSMLSDADLCDVRLLCSPDVSHACFSACAQQYDVVLVPQSGNDLGERMCNGVKDALKQYQYCIVVGTDAPALAAKQISQSIEFLHQDKAVVFVPAEDGGYVLVGMNQPYACLFDGIDWGTENVMQQSRDKLEARAITFAESSSCWDIDRLSDYQRYLAMKP